MTMRDALHPGWKGLPIHAKCATCECFRDDCDGMPDYMANCVWYALAFTAPVERFQRSSGTGWVGIDYVSDSVGITVFIRRDTDLGVIDCNNMMERIGRMSDNERRALVTRGAGQ